MAIVERKRRRSGSKHFTLAAELPRGERRGMVAALISFMCQILVAEDDSEMRRIVVELLQKDGHQVLEAEDGRALSQVLARASSTLTQAAPIDIVVSDVRMPNSNALDVLEQLAGASVRPRIILMTAFANDETRRRSRELGAFLLEKPLSLNELRDAVTAACPATLGSF